MKSIHTVSKFVFAFAITLLVFANIPITVLADEYEATPYVHQLDDNAKNISFKASPEKPTIKSLKSGTSSYTIKWSRVSGASGYQISACTDKSFDFSLNKTITSGKTVSQSITVPTGGIKYYVRMRSYCIVNNKKYYSQWTSAKRVSVKDKSWANMSPEEQVVCLVNKERKSAGLSPVILDKKIKKAGYKRAQEISKYFSHTRPDGRSCFSVLSDYGVKYGFAGENIAAGYGNAQSVMNGWMHSPGHRANILTPDFRRLGVGYYATGSGYRYHWVQLFTD